MASRDFAEKLVKSEYNLNNPLDTARFQQTVSEFMKPVRADSLNDPNGEELMDKFCKLIDDKQVWYLAQMVIPEFRSGREEQVHKYTQEEGHACLIHVLNRLPLLPPPRSDINVLVTEQDMVAQRHKQDVEYLVTRGRGKQGATSDEVDDIEESVRQVEAEKTRLRFKQSIKEGKKKLRERTRKKRVRNEEDGLEEVEEVEEVEQGGQVQEEGGSQGHKQDMKKLVIRGRELRPRVAKETSDEIEKEGGQDGNDDDEDEYNDDDDDDDDEEDDEEGDEEGDDGDREDDEEGDEEGDDGDGEDDTEDDERDYEEDDIEEEEEEDDDDEGK